MALSIKSSSVHDCVNNEYVDAIGYVYAYLRGPRISIKRCAGTTSLYKREPTRPNMWYFQPRTFDKACSFTVNLSATISDSTLIEHYPQRSRNLPILTSNQICHFPWLQSGQIIVLETACSFHASVYGSLTNQHAASIIFVRRVLVYSLGVHCSVDFDIHSGSAL